MLGLDVIHGYRGNNQREKAVYSAINTNSSTTKPGRIISLKTKNFNPLMSSTFHIDLVLLGMDDK